MARFGDVHYDVFETGGAATARIVRFAQRALAPPEGARFSRIDLHATPSSVTRDSAAASSTRISFRPICFVTLWV